MAAHERWLMFFIRAAACGCRCRHCDFAVGGAHPVLPMAAIEGMLGPFIEARNCAAAPFGNLCAVLSDSPLNYQAFPVYAAYLKRHAIEGFGSIAANGFHFRSGPEWESYLRSIRSAGTEYLEFTFYGDRETHDAFAGRKGDFDAIHDLATRWQELGGKVNAPSVMVHKQNIRSLPDLRRALSERFQAPCGARLWSYLGHADRAEDLRPDEGDLSALDGETIECLGAVKPEREWMRELAGVAEKPYSSAGPVIHVAVDHLGNATIPYAEPRLGLQGRPFDRLPTDSAITFIERREAAHARWLEALPPTGELAERYGDPAGSKLYDASIKSKWIQRHLLAQ